MSAPPHGDSREDTGRHSWLAPLSLCLGVVSLALPVLGTPLAVVAIICGVVVMVRLRGNRADWMANTGVTAGGIQIAVSIFLLLAD